MRDDRIQYTRHPNLRQHVISRFKNRTNHALPNPDISLATDIGNRLGLPSLAERGYSGSDFVLGTGPLNETRKLAAILCSDVVGYSRLVGADEDRILARLRALRSDLTDPPSAVNRGRI